MLDFAILMGFVIPFVFLTWASVLGKLTTVVPFLQKYEAALFVGSLWPIATFILYKVGTYFFPDL